MRDDSQGLLVRLFVVQLMQRHGALVATMNIKRNAAFQSMEQDSFIWDPTEMIADDQLASHTVCILGMKRRRGVHYLICHNSYGPSWGRLVCTFSPMRFLSQEVHAVLELSHSLSLV